jgi:hypothetical protein
VVTPWNVAVAASAVAVVEVADEADALIATELARAEPVVWTTHGRLTMLAHAVADRGLRRPVDELLAHRIAEAAGRRGQLGVQLEAQEMANAALHSGER